MPCGHSAASAQREIGSIINTTSGSLSNLVRMKGFINTMIMRKFCVQAGIKWTVWIGLKIRKKTTLKGAISKGFSILTTHLYKTSGF